MAEMLAPSRYATIRRMISRDSRLRKQVNLSAPADDDKNSLPTFQKPRQPCRSDPEYHFGAPPLDRYLDPGWPGKERIQVLRRQSLLRLDGPFDLRGSG